MTTNAKDELEEILQSVSHLKVFSVYIEYDPELAKEQYDYACAENFNPKEFYQKFYWDSTMMCPFQKFLKSLNFEYRKNYSQDHLFGYVWFEPTENLEQYWLERYHSEGIMESWILTTIPKYTDYPKSKDKFVFI